MSAVAGAYHTIRPVTMTDGSKATLHSEELPAGDEGVFKTLSIMEMLVVRDTANEKVRAIVRRNKAKTERETALNLFKFMVRNYKYVADPEDREHFTAPVYILTKTSPFDYRDCDDLAGAMAALLTSAGIENAFKVIAWRPTSPPGQFTHVYNEAKLDGKWTPIDLVMRSYGFNNEKQQIIRSHRWKIGSTVPIPLLLNDQVPLDINWEAIGKDILTRALPKPLGQGEAVGEVLKQHVTAICVDAVKQQLLARKGMIVLASVATGATLMGIGAVVALVIERKKNRRLAPRGATAVMSKPVRSRSFKNTTKAGTSTRQAPMPRIAR